MQKFRGDNYSEVVQETSRFNSRLCRQRRARVPFLDAQTGVAQKGGVLYKKKWQRKRGNVGGVLFTYSAPRWRNQNAFNVYSLPANGPGFMMALDQSDFLDVNGMSNPLNPANNGIKSAGVVFHDENSALSSDGVLENSAGSSKGAWYYKDYEPLSDPPDAGELDDWDSDFEDYEDKKKKKKKTWKMAARGIGSGGGASGGGRDGGVGSSGGGGGSSGVNGTGRAGRMKNFPSDDPNEIQEKPHVCEICSTRYKTKAGLNYHYNHHHQVKQNNKEKDRWTVAEDFESSSYFHSPKSSRGGSHGSPWTPKFPPKTTMEPIGSLEAFAELSASSLHSSKKSMSAMAALLTAGGGAAPGNNPDSSSSASSKDSSSTTPATVAPAALPSSVTQNLQPDNGEGTPTPADAYCDFCLGDARENKKTGRPESLVTCSVCSHSGHPTCLQFTDNMIISVRKYPWQCIECKSCAICGTSDNDDQLLFCDDCDRGYHMYCLDPPLDAPPEGNWSCELCVAEFKQK